MEKYRKYYGIAIFSVACAVLLFVAYHIIAPRVTELNKLNKSITTKESELKSLQSDLEIVQTKIKKIKNSIISSQKKIYSPIESDLGNETIFFTLYNDLIEMVHSNSVKIKSIDYSYNPETDSFVKFGKDIYFVCDVNLELVSNYVNLGKLIQDIYQYPYYIRINSIDIKPYEKDKKVLLTSLSLRMYAHTAPAEETAIERANGNDTPLNNARTPLPQ